ncbi:hypothetical protein AHAS_Ahas07G0081800 [Arachis hypogaea]
MDYYILLESSGCLLSNTIESVPLEFCSSRKSILSVGRSDSNSNSSPLSASNQSFAQNMAIGNHPERVFINPKTNRPFRVEDYPMFIPFLDLKKLVSHNYSICWGAPLKKDDKTIRTPDINISGQKTNPENIKRGKYEWDNWTQDKVDHYRVEYASWILFHEMNQDKAEAISESDAIRLSRPSSLLLSPYCQIDSNDINTD